MNKTDFINELCYLFNKSLTETEVEKYRRAMMNVNSNNLQKILNDIKYGESKFMPKPIDLERMDYKIYKQGSRETSLQFVDTPIQDVCVFCDDVGLIPFVTRYSHPHGQFRAGYGMACKCSKGVNFINKYGDYFEVFPEFEFSDWTRQYRYPQHFYDKLTEMQNDWKSKNLIDCMPL